MNTYNLMMLMGWIVLLASWFPKKMVIKNDSTRLVINLCLASAALAIFLVIGFAKFIYKAEGL